MSLYYRKNKLLFQYDCYVLITPGVMKEGSEMITSNELDWLAVCGYLGITLFVMWRIFTTE